MTPHEQQFIVGDSLYKIYTSKHGKVLLQRYEQPEIVGTNPIMVEQAEFQSEYDLNKKLEGLATPAKSPKPRWTGDPRRIITPTA